MSKIDGFYTADLCVFVIHTKIKTSKTILANTIKLQYASN
jgi:hypothetical protein